MKILVTGAAGFVGSHFCESLLNDGHSVIGLDDFSTGAWSNLANFEQSSNFDFIEHDVREKIDIPCDAIVNFACPASPIHYQSDPIRTMETTFLGTHNLLKLAVKNSIRLLQASTSEVYGDPLVSPQKESDWGNVNPIGVRACYDEGKRAAETLCFDYRRMHGIDVRVMRIFNTYGPRMAVHDGRVVSNFIVQALKGEEITIYGDGLQTRSFCYVSDLVAGAQSFLFHDGTIDTPINLGNSHEFYIRDLAELVIQKTNSKSKITYFPLPQDDPKKRKPDLLLAAQVLSYTPKVELDEGINRTIAYFSEVLK
jgi:UDP-glucuronate decarboxylase